MSNLIDIHCHLDFPDFDSDRDDLIKKTLSDGVWMLTVGTNKESSKKAVEIAKKYKGVFASIGVHPHDTEEGFDAGYYRELAKHPRVVVVGECGMDSVRSRTGREAQKEVFIKQIELATELNKPLMIHCRDAHEEVVEILKSFKAGAGEKLRGNVHFFSGKWQDAENYLEMGFSFSFTGVITFTGDYDEIIKKLPMGKIMIETDAPFVAPRPWRGKRCEPLYVKEVARRIADIKNISYEEVCLVTTENAVKLFGLK